jgi:hypothetical protein
MCRPCLRKQESMAFFWIASQAREDEHSSVVRPVAVFASDSELRIF